MTTNYPGAIDSYTRPTSGAKRSVAPTETTVVDNLYDAVEAIEGELGVNPSGSSATVAARLDAIDAAMATDAEVASAISTHSAASDPHGDRAYALAQASLAREPEIFHTFNDTSMPATVDSGQTLSLKDTGSYASWTAAGLTMTAGGSGARAIYAQAACAGPVVRIGSRIRFTAGSGGQNGVIGLIPWLTSVTPGPTIPATGLHFTINRWRWSLDYIATLGGPIVNVASGEMPYGPLAAGTEYDVDIAIRGNTAFIALPDGSNRTVTHANIGAIRGSFACWEPYQFDATTDDIPVVVAAWADSYASRTPTPTGALASRRFPTPPVMATLNTGGPFSLPTSNAELSSSLRLDPTHYKGQDLLVEFTAAITTPSGASVLIVPSYWSWVGSTLTKQTEPFTFATQEAGTKRIVSWRRLFVAPTYDVAQIRFGVFCTASGGSVECADSMPIIVSATVVNS